MKRGWGDKNPATYTQAKDLVESILQDLINSEKPTEFEKDISPSTRRLLNYCDDSYDLYLIERDLVELPEPDITPWLREKLLKGIGERMTAIDRVKYAMYTFPNEDKQVAKFISLRSGNDLFTMAGLYATFFDKVLKDDNLFFQRNDDRDYTGSLLLEIGTDFLNVRGPNPPKSYQTFLYGFDVYTPYFKDDILFSSDTSINTLDRPHASFQYFGWSKKALTNTNLIRWTFTAKFGKIGGTAGAVFQDVLHKDISHSPKPRGWAAQVANGGRIGVSAEYKIERQLPKIAGIFPSLAFDGKVGTYMTTGALAVQLSNRSFVDSNPNFVMKRSHRKARSWADALISFTTVNASVTATGVVHDTMLEGYGIFRTKEGEYDKFERKSKYYLQSGDVKRLTAAANIMVSYTGRYITYFYNWKSFSPVTNKGDIGINSPYSVKIGAPKHMDISKRWHHFAEIGVVFSMAK